MLSNPINLTVREIVAYCNALPILDGYVEAETIETITTEDPNTKDKKTTTKHTRTKPIPYAFGTDGKGGKIRYIIAKNTSILIREQEVFTKTKDALILELTNGLGTIKEDNIELINKLNVRLQPILDTVISVSGLRGIPLSELNLDENPNLLPSVLAPLMGLIVE